MKKHRTINYRAFAVLIALVIAVIALFCIFLNRWEIQFENVPEEITMNYQSEKQPLKAKAYLTGTIFRFVHEEVEIKQTDNIDPNTFGSYQLKLLATHNKVTAEKMIPVYVKDIEAPVITLQHDPDAYTLFDHPYEEEGYTAIDNVDGDISDQVVVEEADGKVYYTVKDSSGNEASAEREIVYDDRKGPEISFPNGLNPVVYAGEWFDDSFSAVDDLDGDVSGNVVVSGSVDTNTVGSYELSYEVKDSHDNVTQLTRTITVKAFPRNVDDGVVDGHTIYLTFDDGPGQYTDQLLDILDQYGVKATFFTTSAYPNYAYCISKEYQRGHTVAVHTYTHNYATIYQSTDAYWNDFNLQNQVVAQQTGHTTNLFRFPGGSSNTVSRQYCSGVVSTLVSQANNNGYVYFDWNVSSGDAGGVTTSQEVFNNVTNGISNNASYGVPSVVLQHDVKDFSVNAVNDIIVWALENGYHFKALGNGSPTAHHPVAN